MEIKNLKNTSYDVIVECLSKSFKGYFVQIPSEVSFWKNRFKNARVDKSLSWGVFNGDDLVGYVMNGIDIDKGELTAFNTGTGIIEDFRGNKLVDKMYEFGIPKLKEKGVTRCTLEVIDNNYRAIRVYERTGFKITRRIKCYKGVLQKKEGVKIKVTKIDKLDFTNSEELYSWDHNIKAVKTAGSQYTSFQVYDLKNNDLVAGHFIINPANGYIAQMEAYDGNWELIFNGISQISTEIKINNIDEERKDLIAHLNHLGIENVIDQFEMEMKL